MYFRINGRFRTAFSRAHIHTYTAVCLKSCSVPAPFVRHSRVDLYPWVRTSCQTSMLRSLASACAPRSAHFEQWNCVATSISLYQSPRQRDLLYRQPFIETAPFHSLSSPLPRSVLLARSLLSLLWRAHRAHTAPFISVCKTFEELRALLRPLGTSISEKRNERSEFFLTCLSSRALHLDTCKQKRIYFIEVYWGINYGGTIFL